MDNRNTKRLNISPGLKVAIILKRDQPTGKLTEGTVKKILTNSAEHHCGIKVMLEEKNMIGRVQKILDGKSEISMDLVGRVDYNDSIVEIFTDDWKKFFLNKDGGIKMRKEDMECWALYLNSPWTDSHVRYDIRKHIRGIGTGRWECSYTTKGDEMVESSVIGYGINPSEALHQCQLRFAEIQKKFNPYGKRV